MEHSTDNSSPLSPEEPKFSPQLLLERVALIVRKPQECWITIKAEPANLKSTMIQYLLPAALCIAIGNFFLWSVYGSSAFGVTVKAPIMQGIISSLLSLVLSLVAVLIMGGIASFLAPKFSGKESFLEGVRLVGFSYLPIWISHLLYIIPLLGLLILFVSLYCLVIFYKGIPVMMEVPTEKRVIYFVLVLVFSIVASLLLGVLAYPAMNTIQPQYTM